MCGNVTLMGRLIGPEKAALPARGRTLLQRMLRVSQMRGAQSGGGAIQISKNGQPRQLIRKCVNPKRGDLGTRLAAALESSAGSRPAFGGTFLVQSHVRYATAGVTTEHEAHPFRFVDASERGLRRVYLSTGGTWSIAVRPIETAITHNGDIDGLRWRGTTIAYPDLGCFLERVLGFRNRWNGDSPLLAAAIELYLTRGMWFESLRLAYHLTLAPDPPDLASLPAELDGDRRKAALRKLLEGYPVPPRALIERWEGLAEAGFAESLATPAGAWSDDPSAQRRGREQLILALVARFQAAGHAEIAPARMPAFVRAAVNAFFDNDLYIALRKLEPALEGTFGCVVTSTLEPGCLVALSRGQPLSLGFQRGTGTVGVASERAALKVRGLDGALAFDERLDLDLCRGEIARVVVDDARPISLTLYGIADGREYDPADLVSTGRLVPLAGNPYVSELPLEARDRVAVDLEAVAPLLRGIRQSFRDPGAHNAATARAFAEALLARERPRLLLIGITNDLWLAQQFARNLKRIFPAIAVEARSSNEVLADASTTSLDPDAVVLAVSQSGQDFPTLGALVLLLHASSGKSRESFFVLSGEVDSLMGQAVGQSYASGAPFSRRIFTNLSGFRPSEAAVATVNATQHTFVELLLELVEHALDARRFPQKPHGLELGAQDLVALRTRRDLCVDRQAPLLTGKPAQGRLSELSRQVAQRSRRWSWHVLEGIVAFALAVLVLELNLQGRLGLTPSRLVGLAARFSGPAPEWLSTLLTQTDVLFYAFLAPLAVWTLRTLQGRPAFHRQGMRELLIGDTRYVHQILWLLARKLFGLSYGFASIKPYSADCQDELILLHEPLRGTLALIGIPDARRVALRTRAASALMTAKQFNNSRSFAGAGAEIVTVSHAPRPPGNAFGAHLVLPGAGMPSSHPTVEHLFEDMFDSWERLMAMQVFLDCLARGVATVAALGYDRSRTKDQVFAPTTASPVSAAAIYQLLARTSERYEHAPDPSLPFEVVRSKWRGSAPPARTTVWRTDT